jgi:polypeptide N-acetylgalactosaminyltransferase
MVALIEKQVWYNVEFDVGLELAGWLEPLLGRIAADKRHVVAPVIDNINDDTLQFAWFSPDQIHVGKFDWDLTFNWMPIPSYVKDKMKTNVDPVRLVSDS